MSVSYYTLTYREYKKHAHHLHGAAAVAHTLDDPMTDDSQLVLKVDGPDHVHHFLEKQNVEVLPTSHQSVLELTQHHPVMRHR